MPTRSFVWAGFEGWPKPLGDFAGREDHFPAFFKRCSSLATDDPFRPRRFMILRHAPRLAVVPRRPSCGLGRQFLGVALELAALFQVSRVSHREQHLGSKQRMKFAKTALILACIVVYGFALVPNNSGIQRPRSTASQRHS